MTLDTPQPAGSILRAFCVATALLLGLSGCGSDAGWSFSGESGRILPGLPGTGWTALPLGRFVTRDTVRPDVLEFCRRERCGFDAVVTRFTASGAEARLLAETAAKPARLVAAIGRQDQERQARGLPAGKQRIGEPAPVRVPAKIAAEPFAAGDWQGVVVSITGGPADRAAYGAVLQRPDAKGLAVIVAVAPSANAAEQIARAAALAPAAGL